MTIFRLVWVGFPVKLRVALGWGDPIFHVLDQPNRSDREEDQSISVNSGLHIPIATVRVGLTGSPLIGVGNSEERRHQDLRVGGKGTINVNRRDIFVQSVLNDEVTLIIS